jgi:hypothetical protein
MLVVIQSRKHYHFVSFPTHKTELYIKLLCHSFIRLWTLILRIESKWQGKKVEVKLSLCLTKHHAMKTYGWSGGIASRPRRFTPREIAPGTHRIGGWLGPRAGLYTVSKSKIPSLRRESNPDYPIVQPIASRYTDWAIPAQKINENCVENEVLRYIFGPKRDEVSEQFGEDLCNLYLSPVIARIVKYRLRWTGRGEQ